MKYETTLFKRESMMHKEETVLQVAEGAKVSLGDASFDKDIISKIKVFKWHMDLESEASIFVELFMGNMDICTGIYSSDVALEIVSNERGVINSYNIREARSYDYKGQ